MPVLQFKNFLSAVRLPYYATFGIFPANYDTSWIYGFAGGGGGGGLSYRQDLSASCNGSNQNFTLLPTPATSPMVLVVWNQLIQRYGVDYTLSAGSLHTNFIAGSGDSLICYW